MIIQLDENYIEEMLALQADCLNQNDIFLPTSREGYLRAFQFDNFCYGYMDGGRLIAFLNCSIPSSRGRSNLGRGRIADCLLDRVGHMNTLLVRRNCRQHGVGHDLVEWALSEFRRRSCSHIFVTASPRNAGSLKLLNFMAFQPVEMVELHGETRQLFYRNLSAEENFRSFHKKGEALVAPAAALARMMKSMQRACEVSEEVIEMENYKNCSEELHLHEVQGSVQLACSNCDSHNHRFATVTCEPVELANGNHVHQLSFRTDSYNGHYHEFTGRTQGATRVGDGHVHYIEGVTTESNGHRHKFKVITHIEDPIED